MRQLPTEPQSENIRALAQMYHERFTGLTTVTITLLNEPARTVDDVGLEQVFRNGVLLDVNGAGAGSYTIDGKVITLGAAAGAGDNFHVYYPYRGGV